MSSDVKRGKLRHVEIRPNYDDKGKVKDHTVSAHHENASKGKDDMYRYPDPIEDHPVSKEEAMSVAKAHLAKNEEEQGHTGRMSKGRSLKEAIGSA